MSTAATIATPPAHRSGGLAWGVFGMVLFSMSLPATRLAVGGFDPVFVASARRRAAAGGSRRQRARLCRGRRAIPDDGRPTGDRLGAGALPACHRTGRRAALGFSGHATARLPAWAGLAYVAFISQYLGFVAWYRGLSRGGIARIGHVQLAQPVLSMAWAVLLLGEAITPSAAIAAVAVLACVVVTQKAR